jgi:hypothetical protein
LLHARLIAWLTHDVAVACLVGRLIPARSAELHAFRRRCVLGHKNDNLFVSCNAQQAPGTGTVVEFKAGPCTPIDTGIKLGYAGGIVIDGSGHIAVIDQEVPSLNVYDVGKSKPVATLKLPSASAYIAFNRTSKVLFVADYSKGEIDVFDYAPSKLQRINKITNGITASSDNMGIAVAPAQRL